MHWIIQSIMLRAALWILSVVLLIAPSLQSSQTSRASAEAHHAAQLPTHALSNTASLDLSVGFIPNVGQLDSRVLYSAQSDSSTIFMTTDTVWLALPIWQKHYNSAPIFANVGFHYLDANPMLTLTGVEPHTGHVNYFLGDQSERWHRDIVPFTAVHYNQLYPGIQARYDVTSTYLKSTYVIEPYADPTHIRWTYEHAVRSELLSNGTIQATLQVPSVTDSKQPLVVTDSPPNAWQIVAGRQVGVPIRYQQLHDGSFQFQISSYDRTLPLTIDPTLSYSSYMGGSGADYGRGIATDQNSNVYITGKTYSTDFATLITNPTTSPSGNGDVFVAKMNPEQTAFVYTSYFGGSNDDGSRDIAVDTAGNAYIIGTTSSSDFIRVDAQQTQLNGIRDAFVTKLNPQGNQILHSTYLGGTAAEAGYGIAVIPNGDGSAYVTGVTWSTNFFQLICYPCVTNGSSAFVAKISTTSASMGYTLLLSANYSTQGHGIAVDSTGTVYVTGQSLAFGLYSVLGYQPGNAGGLDAFITLINTNGAVVKSTYYGGPGDDCEAPGDDRECSIAIDSGFVYITGPTLSSTGIATSGSFSTAYQAGMDVFVAKLTLDLNTRLFGTYLGGNGDDSAYGIKVDSVGHMTITGSTTSTNYPTAPINNTFQPNKGGSRDAFISTLQPDGAVLMQSTYVGGTNNEDGYRIDLSKRAYISPNPTPTPGQEYMYVDGIANITGSTTSANLPKSNALQGSLLGTSDAFVSRLSPYAKTTSSYYIFAILPSTMSDLGCQQGARDILYPGLRDSLAIIDFGSPKYAYDSNGMLLPGTKLFNGQPRSTYQISLDVQNFITGYLNCSTGTNHLLTVVIATNNKGGSITYNHGKSWALLVNSVSSWASSVSQRVVVAGASDMEMDFNNPVVTKDWVNGYIQYTALNLYNFGDASGCPDTGNGTINGICDVGWTQDDIIYVSNGGPNGNNRGRAIPEIYANSGVNARQWYQIALRAINTAKVLTFSGALTQYQGCIDHPLNPDGSYACMNNGGLKDQPAELGWRWLFDTLNADPQTRLLYLRWSTDIRWEYFRIGY